MSREQGPGVDREGPQVRERREPAEEGCAVRVVGKDRAPFESSHHHVVERAGRRFRTKGGRASRGAWRGMAQPTLTHSASAAEQRRGAGGRPQGDRSGSVPYYEEGDKRDVLLWYGDDWHECSSVRAIA